GAADLAMDPHNPDKLYAAMWDYRRWPWFFRSGGPGSGLYVSHDGGATWERQTPEDGLPEGDLGRIGIAICHDFPDTVYALVEAETSELLRSTDGGRTWETRNDDPGVANRPFYYADLRCDPQWPNRIYDLASRMRFSEDGGTTLRRLSGSRQVHADFQALWLNPADGRHMIVGTDGGVAITRDRGATFRFVRNLPLAQYYHVAVDMDEPYHVYGGLQDNGSWQGPSRVEHGAGISNLFWTRIGFGDGFDTRPDPESSRRGYAMWQGGGLLRWDLETGATTPIKPTPVDADGEPVDLRFNWSAAIAQDPFDAGTIYYGSQFVHRSTDRGESWTTISPDLTTDDGDKQQQTDSGGLTPDVTGAENYTTLITIVPSPLARGTLWVGSDDGRLHRTVDGGETWTSLEDRLTGGADQPPVGTWIPHVHASSHDVDEAFVVFEDHRRSNWTPYLMHTIDGGVTWRNLVDAGDPVDGYALSVAQDPVDPDLLFLGTEFGLWVSTDRGDTWWKHTHGVPTVSVMDMVIHPRDHDLVLGTHGRGIFVLDDIAPLRTVAEVADEALHLFPVRPVRQYLDKQQRGGRAMGAGEYQGENLERGALLHVWVTDAELRHPDGDAERLRQEAERRAAGEAAATTAATAEADSTDET
ncbi:MAG: hypothetical protein AAGE94_24440, partial [Acidobacteriota bacterium]